MYFTSYAGLVKENVLVQDICDTSPLVNGYCHCEARSAEAISGVVGGQACDGEIASLHSQ